ncbi:MAG: helix-turn-helix domain-containing protein [Bacteroidetes bacterium]|nr:helix-turn-helix domain-containing protein [Bacteroidota bacterium]
MVAEDKTNLFFKLWYKILPDEKLTDLSKLLLHEILYFIIFGSNQDYCFATNDHLANRLNKHSKTISKGITKLVNTGYLRRELDREGVMVSGRRLIPVWEKLGISENANNNINNTLLDNNITMDKEDKINNKFINIILNENANPSSDTYYEELFGIGDQGMNFYFYNMAVELKSEFPEFHRLKIANILHNAFDYRQSSKTKGYKLLIKKMGTKFLHILVKHCSKNLKSEPHEVPKFPSSGNQYYDTMKIASILKKNFLHLYTEPSIGFKKSSSNWGSLSTELEIINTADYYQISVNRECRVMAVIHRIEERKDKSGKGYFANIYFSSERKPPSSYLGYYIAVIDADSYMKIRLFLKTLIGKEVVMQGQKAWSGYHKKEILKSLANKPFLMSPTIR